MSYYEDCWKSLQEEKQRWFACPLCGEKSSKNVEGDLCEKCSESIQLYEKFPAKFPEWAIRRRK